MWIRSGNFVFVFVLPGFVLGGLQLAPGQSEVGRNLNESYIVTCRGLDAVDLAWKDQENKIITKSIGRVHIEKKGEPVYGLALVFESIARQDKGNYTCIGTINGTKEEVSFKLNIFKPISFQGSFAEQNLIEGKSDTVKCEAGGDPAPTIIWHFRGKDLPIHGKRYKSLPMGLYINNITRNDAGLYLCRAFQMSLIEGSTKDQYITVHVHYRPTWKHNYYSENGTVQGYWGGTANLTCMVEAVPEANFTWTRNNKTIDPELKIVNDPNKSVLQIPMTNRSVLGMYECKAVNYIGEIWHQFVLHEGKKPPKPNSISVGTIGANSANIHIYRASVDTIGYRIQFVKRYPKYDFSHPDYQDVFSRDAFPYTIVNLTENTDYMFRVATRNIAGLSEYSDEYSFRTRIRAASSAVVFTVSLSSLLFATVPIYYNDIYSKLIHCC